MLLVCFLIALQVNQMRLFFLFLCLQVIDLLNCRGLLFQALPVVLVHLLCVLRLVQQL